MHRCRTPPPHVLGYKNSVASLLGCGLHFGTRPQTTTFVPSIHAPLLLSVSLVAHPRSLASSSGEFPLTDRPTGAACRGGQVRYTHTRLCRLRSAHSRAGRDDEERSKMSKMSKRSERRSERQARKTHDDCRQGRQGTDAKEERVQTKRRGRNGRQTTQDGETDNRRRKKR